MTIPFNPRGPIPQEPNANRAWWITFRRYSARASIYHYRQAVACWDAATIETRRKAVVSGVRLWWNMKETTP